MPFTECLYGVPCVTLMQLGSLWLKHCHILALLFFVCVVWACVISHFSFQISTLNCSNILVYMYFLLWLLSYAYRQRGREDKHSRGGGSAGGGLLDTTRTFYSKYVVVTSMVVLAAALQYLMFKEYSRASWQCNRPVSCVSRSFSFWSFFFSVMLVSKQFWGFYVYFVQELSMFPPEFVAKYWFTGLEFLNTSS
jgi:Ca2+/Na+ antiporter